MDYREVAADREFLISLSHGADWHEEIESFAAEQDVEAAWLVGWGTVDDASLGYFDREAFAYETVSFPEPLEMPTCVGSVAMGEEGPEVTAHVTLSRPSGQALSGRLERATVYDGECYLRSFAEPLERSRDETTGREGWDL